MERRLVREDGVHRGLNIIADHAASPARCGHGASVGIGEGDMLVRFREHPDLKPF
jgi:hypothetical protein